MTESIPCDLCGLGCGAHPLGQKVSELERHFCCVGCMNVYLILVESGVVASGQDLRETEVFKRSLELGLIARRESPETETGEATANADSPTRDLLVQVTGMWCSSCAWLIEHVLRKERGIVAAKASFASDTVKVTYRPQCMPPQRVLDKIEGLGYKAHQYSGEKESGAAEKRDLLLRLGLASFLWANIMSLSLVVYAGYFEPITYSVRRYLPFLLMALATPVITYCAAPILRLAWRGLLHGAIRMEALLALGIGAAYVYSSVQAFAGERHLYFDTVSVIVMLVLAGKLIEREAKAKATRWIANLHRMAPNKVRLLSGGDERFVSIDALEPGTLFVVKVGERIVADGVVEEGASHADESLLTGESRPVAKDPGATVIAGSVNLSGVLKVRALRTASQSALAQIIAQVERALSTRSPVERMVDKVSRIFVPAVIVLAIATFTGLSLWGFGSGAALMRAIAVLVIACPCALGLATPLAITSAMGAASRAGILINDSRVLETLQKLDVMLLDKTGTVTEGRFAVLHHEWIAAEVVSTARVLAIAGGPIDVRTRVRIAMPGGPASAQEGARLVASLERYSEHPLGKAVVEFARQQQVRLTEARGIEIRKGQGITGEVEGHRVFVGSRRLVDELSATFEVLYERRAQHWESEGKTVAFYGWDGQFQGMFVMGDRVRAEARRLVADLQQRSVEVRLVSGDAELTTQAVSADLGCDSYRAEALPQVKGEIIEVLQQRGKTVAMVGDGINDAPALAQADLGIAIGSGTDLAMRASAVVLLNGSLERIPAVLDLARKSMRIVRQNLFWAFFYNTVGIVLAITGVLNPILAAAAMLLSSASVIANTMRLSNPPELTQ